MPIFVLILFFGGQEGGKYCEIVHKLKVMHPGISLDKPVECNLIQSQCDLGQPNTFYIDVESVVCGDQQCRVDVVRLVWDELGFYKALVLKPGVDLEKAEGESFNKSDYEKLDKVLSDRKSGLANVFKNEIVQNQVGESSVDASSGATIQLDTRDYVKGAVWTCYTLWHWVNGDVHDIVRNITGDAKTTEELRNFIRTGSRKYKIFALEQLTKRKSFDSETIQEVLGTRLENDDEWANLVVDYVDHLPMDAYYSSMEKLLEHNNGQLRSICLNSMLRTAKIPPPDYFDRLSHRFSIWNSYQEINSFLSILKSKNVSSPEVVKNVMGLLENNNFIIARRAYWFLKDQNLSASQENTLKTFYLKNGNKL